MSEGDGAPGRRRSTASLIGIGVAAALVFGVLAALGTWQVERRSWKLDLIERVEARVHASAVAAPDRLEWPLVTAAGHEYRHVRVTGVFLHDLEAQVVASTALGAGYWVLTPLRALDGTLVLVNRGFVPQDRRDPATRRAGEPVGEVTVTGLLRISEPGGTALRSNDPAADRWYSRDVAAIAAARGLTAVAPYFIDADAATSGPEQPVGGMTVIAFHNNHLVYAVTWYGLALMVAFGAVHVIRHGARSGSASKLMR
ncbi:SURF1 family protein [Skermanella stibiiresistens]|uniref:SURF1 family protein n=1 Tax=Skermanella stibiiresistens TaxID=913326 RepID=UPI0004B82EA4|nr:SURF1 family protein [Skermanella stibiiresistens]